MRREAVVASGMQGANGGVEVRSKVKGVKRASRSVDIPSLLPASFVTIKL